MDYVGQSRIPVMVKEHQSDVLAQWLEQQLSASTLRRDLMKESELREQSRRFLDAFRQAVQNSVITDLNDQVWDNTRGILNDISNSRVRQGFSSSETAIFIFSLKQPLFEILRQELAREPLVLADEIWAANTLLDQLGLLATEFYQKSREEVITRQQQELL